MGKVRSAGICGSRPTPGYSIEHEARGDPAEEEAQETENLMIAKYKCQRCGNEMVVYWVNANPLGTVRCDNCGFFGQRERGMKFRFRAWLVKIFSLGEG